MVYVKSKKQKARQEKRRTEKMLKQRHIYGHRDPTPFNAVQAIRDGTFENIII